MQILTEIFRTEGAPREGKAVLREAVRGIVLNGREVFMIHSPVNGDYKFPGGGVHNPLASTVISGSILTGTSVLSISRK